MPQSQMITRQVGRQLLQLRKDAGLTNREDPRFRGVASASTLIRVERGQGPITFKTVAALLALYGASDETQTHMLAMVQQLSTPGLSEDFGSLVIPDWFGLFADLERYACKIRSYDTEFMPGLLQSEDYARAVFASEGDLPADVVEHRVGFRMRRQAEVLNGERDVTMILSEAALHRMVGSPRVLANQLARVAKLAHDGECVVRVLPWQAGAYPRRGEYVLFDFPDSVADPPVAYTEMPFSASYMEKPEQLTELNHNFDLLLSKSVSFGEYL
jgi:Domain of unknown function (DUF5753)